MLRTLVIKTLFFGTLLFSVFLFSSMWIREDGNLVTWFWRSRLPLAEKTIIKGIIVREDNIASILQQPILTLPRQLSKNALGMSSDSKQDSQLYLLVTVTPNPNHGGGTILVTINETEEIKVNIGLIHRQHNRGYYSISLTPIDSKEIFAADAPSIPNLKFRWLTLYSYE